MIGLNRIEAKLNLKLFKVNQDYKADEAHFKVREMRAIHYEREMPEMQCCRSQSKACKVFS